MLQFDRVEGPACPSCGCEDSVEVGQFVRWGKPATRRRCGHCRETFVAADPADTEPTDDAVAFIPIRCPVCKSPETRVTSTRKPVRYHRCNACKHTFKSVERRTT